MVFDPENKINKLCAQGMQLEGEGKPHEAAELFRQVWSEASNILEKFTAAHYVARHQNSLADKLAWDETALSLALEMNSKGIDGVYPSLYLNIAKGHEDLKNFAKAKEHYQLARQYAMLLPDDGYNNMIKAGIQKGIERLNHDGMTALPGR